MDSEYDYSDLDLPIKNIEEDIFNLYNYNE